jgi:hypothetical protein
LGESDWETAASGTVSENPLEMTAIGI